MLFVQCGVDSGRVDKESKREAGLCMLVLTRSGCKWRSIGQGTGRV